MIRVLLATGNPHKLDEVRPVLHPLGIEVVGLDVLDEIPPEPVEDGGERLARLVVAGGHLHDPRVRRLRRVQVAHLEVALSVLQPHRRLINDF